MNLSDRDLIRICLAITIGGIIGLAIYVQMLQPIDIQAREIEKYPTGSIVKVSGTIMMYSEKDGNVFIKLGDNTGNLSLVMFEIRAINQPFVYDLKQGRNISAIGKITFYRGQLEIIADKIMSE